ncbi:protein GAMETE EXPRESSED 2-like [Triticum dicoccoides]|uniref:protein GAMETE EXPRESSED 2-like n=1 Tax=Triticum dicoccoides TaxID=85692 RepID=UPI00188F415F|nr:protein GAMETE EXPRESSED 2-like [Triticum dicoccoides]
MFLCTQTHQGQLECRDSYGYGGTARPFARNTSRRLPPCTCSCTPRRILLSLPPRPSPATERNASLHVQSGSKSMANRAALSPRPILAISLLLCLAPLRPTAAQEQWPQYPITPRPAFMFRWVDDNGSFRAGDTATVMITSFYIPDANVSEVRRKAAFKVTLHGHGDKAGNTSYLTDVAVHLEGDLPSWNITLVPLRAGDFVALFEEERFFLGVDTLNFAVAARDVSPSASLASWTHLGGRRVAAGSRAFVSVFPRDALGNGLPRGADMPFGNWYFAVSWSYVNGTPVQFSGLEYNGWTEDACMSIEFVPTLAGDFLVHVHADNTKLRGSPLPLTVKPGLIDIAKSTAEWKHGTNAVQIFSKLEIFINQRDSFGNLVPGIHSFDAAVVESASRLSVPVGGLRIEAVAEGIQRLSFDVVEPGEFVLTIFETHLKQRLSDTVYVYHVFVGYCDGSKSIVNGSGLVQSVAGSPSSFMVYLVDQYGSPSPVDTKMLRVQILSRNGTSGVNPVITPVREPNETISTDGQTSNFNVSYTPEIAGEYEIWVLCGNVALNDGKPYNMTLSPGAVDTSLSTAPMFDPKAKRSVRNNVTVRLVDSFMNPVVSLEPKLRLQLTSANVTAPMNASSFTAGEFVNNRDGSYTAHYVARYLGLYGMCILFDSRQLAPCPFQVLVLPDEYFSEVREDHISVWEDESVSFDILSNDYIAVGLADVVNLSSPLHGAVLQYNPGYRYTPFERFFGNDSFSYTVSDKHGNVVSGTVFISVLCRPPQFISLPKQLHVTEDIIGPKFGGFPGIEMTYSDTSENISVTVRAQHGNVLLAPVPMKLQHLLDDTLSISRVGRSSQALKIQGVVEEINGALKYLQYIGNQDFYGDDVIMLYARNRNGRHRDELHVSVEPVNDPPVILAPKSIFLGGKESRDGYQIFDKQRDPFEFSIVEPDLRWYPGNKSHLLLVLSLEVFEGTLMMTLPASLVGRAELKTGGSNQWQSLQTYVAIAHHLVLRGTGIRLRLDVADCNSAMHRLFYQGGPSHGTSLSITVDDLGNYGCYPDCSEMMSRPLQAAKTVQLSKRKAMNSTRAILTGSAIAIEILAMLCLGGVLLYFLVKCMCALRIERTRGRPGNEVRTSERTMSHQLMSSSPSDDAGYSSAPAAVLSMGGNRSGFRQRSCRSWKQQELEMQQLSGIRNDGNQDDQPVVDKDK